MSINSISTKTKDLEAEPKSLLHLISNEDAAFENEVHCVYILLVVNSLFLIYFIFNFFLN
jgi:hypothetical protein